MLLVEIIFNESINEKYIYVGLVKFFEVIVDEGMGLVVLCVELFNLEGLLMLGLFVKGYVIISKESGLFVF